ncbi:AlpA family phage regulatory protein [Paraburkholderia sp. SUR17]|uniref:helix-turn-helix transcriptional regulator n=1 Tax=Paraburkholderia sp. SUR17 TaxID=3034358 RepID=UPI0024083E8B|nr:AlpA family phage regulatory protein [Paraburkholderia sp. SUR17]WEY37774.1 AlpA family phage regulatory protein [Paraburkholderia sp. SUR17]
MQIQVELPDGPLIEYWSFCQAIARAVSPADENPIEGSDCIVRKRIRRTVFIDEPENTGRNPYLCGLQNVLVSDDGRTLDGLLPRDGEPAPTLFGKEPAEVVEHFVEASLTDHDRRELAALLPRLPVLRYPVSDEAACSFLDAYCSLSARPEWAPVLITVADVEARRAKQRQTLTDHQRALQADCSRGLMVAIDERHMHVPVLKVGCLISREDAIGYLKRHRLPYEEGVAGQMQRSKDGSANRQHERPSGEMLAPIDRDRKTAAPERETSPTKRTARVHPTLDEAQTERSDTDSQVRKRGRIIRLSRVEELTGLQRSSIYNRMNPKSRYYDPTFPGQFSLSETAGGAVGWYEDEVLHWVAQRGTVSRSGDQ